MESASTGSQATEQRRFGSVAMNDGSVMKVALDDDGHPRVQSNRAIEPAQIASLKALRSSVKSILCTKQDDVALNILMYIISNEPVSVYRVAKTVPYNFSLTYKKANRLLREGLIRPIPAVDSKDRRCRRLFESTVKGLLTGWNLGYMDDRELLESLMKKWGIGSEGLSKLEYVFNSLPRIVSEKDTAILQDLPALAAAVADSADARPAPKRPRPGDVDADGEKYASRYVLAHALKRVCRGSIVVFASAGYTISYEPEMGRTFIYDCTLCDRDCSMTEVSPRSPKCKALNDLLGSFSLQSSPRA